MPICIPVPVRSENRLGHKSARQPGLHFFLTSPWLTPLKYLNQPPPNYQADVCLPGPPAPRSLQTGPSLPSPQVSFIHNGVLTPLPVSSALEAILFLCLSEEAKVSSGESMKIKVVLGVPGPEG